MSAHTGATTNYSTQQPSYEYTDRTTQFDDALLQRGIVTEEQVLLAKGMSIRTAEQLLLQQKQRKNEDDLINNSNVDVTCTTTTQNNPYASNDDSDAEYDDCDDEFLKIYNERRINELYESAQNDKQRTRKFGDVITIDRTEWQHHVNDDSNDAWVVVGLLSTYDSNRTGMMKKAICELACLYVETKFILISSHQAIENWPEENLPSVFIYRHGKLQHEWIRLPIQLTTEQLEDRLHDLSVI
jgi:Phosducin